MNDDAERVEIVLPPRAASQMDLDLVELTKLLVERGLADEVGGALGGRYGYGAAYENDTFVMRPFYWGDCTCGWVDAVDAITEPMTSPTYLGLLEGVALGPNGHSEECLTQLPNFLHKATGLELRWYKWIGRDMHANKQIAGRAWPALYKQCLASLPPGAP